MRKAILALLLILCPAIALGQTTSLTVQVTDLSGQTWNNGTWQAQLIGNGPPFYNSGTTTPVPNQFQSGALSNSGTFTATFTQNAGIAPAQTQWAFQFCSNTSSSLGCYNINYVVTATTNLTVNPPTPVVIAGQNARAYADATVVAQQGQTYYNVISLNMRVCQTSVGSPTTPLCTVWVGIGGSGPGGLPRLDQVLNQAGNKLFDQGTGTIGFTDGPGLDLSGETSGLNVPHVANCLPTAIGLLCYDTVGNNYVAYNGVGAVVGLIPFGVQNNHVAGFSVSGGQIQFTDLGPLNATSGNSILNVLLTNVQEGDSICYNAPTSQFVNCTEGVPINVQSGASYTIASTDRGTYVDLTDNVTTAVSLPQASSSTLFGANFFTFVKADSANSVITPTTSNISFHGRTSATTINMAIGEGCSILSDPAANSGNGTYYPRCSPTQDPEGDPMLIPFGVDVNTTGWYSWEIANNTGTGTTLNKAACNDGTGKAVICSHTTSTTNNALGVAVNGDGVAPGNTGSTGICSLGFCKIIMDNTATAGHYAQESPTVDGDFTDVGATQPANSQDFYFIVSGNSGAGTAAVIRMMAPQELTAAQINGGGKTTININGGGTQPVTNFSSSGQCSNWTTSNSGNTTTAVYHPCHAIAFTMGSPGGTALTVASSTTDYITVPFACTLKAYDLSVDAGTITVKFWKVATGTAIPTSGNSINTSGVGVASGTHNHSTTMTDFTTTAVAQYDIMAMNVTAVSTAAYVNGVLFCQE